MSCSCCVFCSPTLSAHRLTSLVPGSPARYNCQFSCYFLCFFLLLPVWLCLVLFDVKPLKPQQSSDCLFVCSEIFCLLHHICPLSLRLSVPLGGDPDSPQTSHLVLVDLILRPCGPSIPSLCLRRKPLMASVCLAHVCWMLHFRLPALVRFRSRSQSSI